MKAVVFHDVGEVRLDEVPEPQIKAPTDAVVEITATAISSLDALFVSGAIPGMKPGTILGREAVGIVVEAGPEVRNFRRGDRVVVPATIACGNCCYCRAGYYAQCDHANPHGRRSGPAFFGGPKHAGSYDGLLAEYARVPFANTNLVRLPDEVANDQAIFLSDIFPSGYFGAELAEVGTGDVVAVFGCGPVGQFAIFGALHLGAARVIAIDNLEDRLEAARALGAEVINFDIDDPVRSILDLTRGIGPDRAIDAVGVAAHGPRQELATPVAEDELARLERQRSQVAPLEWQELAPHRPGEMPMQAIKWAAESIAKAGTLAIVGTYPLRCESFPLGRALDRGLTVKLGLCHHRRYISQLIRMVASGAVDPAALVPRGQPLLSVEEAYEALQGPASDWLQVDLVPTA